MQKAVPWGRIQAKDVKGQPKDTPTFSAMANGQIKGVLVEMLGEYKVRSVFILRLIAV
jgi:hypothetical protein